MLIRKTKTVKINFRKNLQEIADFCGVHVSTVYRWKAGRSFPGPRHCAKLAELEELSKKK